MTTIGFQSAHGNMLLDQVPARSSSAVCSGVELDIGPEKQGQPPYHLIASKWDSRVSFLLVSFIPSSNSSHAPSIDGLCSTVRMTPFLKSGKTAFLSLQPGVMYQVVY